MPGRILVVEDDELLSLLLRCSLEAEGFTVELACRAEDADPVLRDCPPDLLLLDWILPGISGLELCGRLRQRLETKFLPIIMMTGLGAEGDRVRGLSAGADDYIVKPFSVPELVLRVRALLRRYRPALVHSVVRVADIELDRDCFKVSAENGKLRSGRRNIDCSSFLVSIRGRPPCPNGVDRAFYLQETVNWR